MKKFILLKKKGSRMRQFSISTMQSLLGDPALNAVGLARKIGVSPSTLSTLKSGGKPSVDTLVAIADAIGRPLDFFFEEKLQHAELKAANQ